MPRPTPTFTLSADEAEALQTIMQKNPDGSLAFKRAAVVLACAEGKQGKEIARQYDVTPNRVIDWRRRFEQGGVEGLMTDAPHPGKAVKNGVPVVDMVKEALAATPADADSWTSLALAKHLGISHPSVKTALKKLGITLPEKTQGAQAVFPDLEGKRVCVIGLFLTLSVQILALVIYSADDKPLFPVGKRITVSSATNGSLQSQWQTTDDCLGFDLACTMHRLSGLTTGEDPVERTGKAADFVRELQNAIKDTGKQLYLVLHAPTAIVPDKSLIGMFLSSTEEFTETATRWFRALDDNSNVVGMLSENTDRLLKNAPEHCEPFIWRVVQDGNQPQSVISHNQSAGDNELSLSLSFKDKSGATVTCSNVQFNAVPNSEDFQRCRTVRDFERLASELEQGLIKTVREVETAFMNQTLGGGSISENLKKKLIKDPGQES